jgi:succinate dehydrogenase / fumarate reductase iron-sulfur subunit
MASALLKIRRQDDPDDLPYWELFEIASEPGMTVAAALEAIARNPVTAEGNPTAPVAWECSCREGLCGSCAMQIGGRVRLACQVRLEEFDGPVTLEPLSKFPVVRDLAVDRLGMMEALGRHGCFTVVDGLRREGDVPRASAEEERAAVLLDCVMCGACSEACPQVNERQAFAGAFVMARILPLNAHRHGSDGSARRLDALAGRGGVADCAGVGNCEMVCPRGLPLGRAASMLGLSTAIHSIRRLLWG